MAYKVINLRAGDNDVHRFDEGLEAAKRGLKEVSEIWENMKRDFQMRDGNSGGYGQRSYNDRYNGGGYMGERDELVKDKPVVISERDWDELQERRRRDSSGRFM
jgi:hypothetical protein